MLVNHVDRQQVDNAKDAYRRKAKECHPDIGGSAVAMAEINAAYNEATRAA
jgi:curved DNA-binding protein CbpA